MVGFSTKAFFYLMKNKANFTFIKTEFFLLVINNICQAPSLEYIHGRISHLSIISLYNFSTWHASFVSLNLPATDL